MTEKDSDGFVLCHHGRPIRCLECGADYERELADAGQRVAQRTRRVPLSCADIDGQTWHKDGEVCTACGFGQSVAEGVRWLVVRKREADTPEVYPFADEATAKTFYDRAQQQWSDCYLTLVVRHGMRPARPIVPDDFVALANLSLRLCEESAQHPAASATRATLMAESDLVERLMSAIIDRTRPQGETK
jgi:ribosomal protein L37E